MIKKSLIYFAFIFSIISLNAQQQQLEAPSTNSNNVENKAATIEKEKNKKLEKVKELIKKHPILTIAIAFTTISLISGAIANIKKAMTKETQSIPKPVVLPGPKPKEILEKMSSEEQKKYLDEAEAEFEEQKENFLQYLKSNPQNLKDFNAFFKNEVKPLAPGIYTFEYKGYKQVPFNKIYSLIEEGELSKDEKGNLKIEEAKNQSQPSSNN